EQRLMRRAERLERRQLDHSEHGPLEENRQHDDVQGRRLTQSRVDLDVVRRHLREQDPLLLQRALADETLAQTEEAAEVLSFLEAVAGLELQHRLSAVAQIRQRVEDAVLRGDKRRQLGKNQV